MDRDLGRDIAEAGANADRAREKADLQRDRLARMAKDDPRRPTEDAILDPTMRNADAADIDRSRADGKEGQGRRQPVDMQVIREMEEALMAPVPQPRHKRPGGPLKKAKDMSGRRPLTQPRAKPERE